MPGRICGPSGRSRALATIAVALGWGPVALAQAPTDIPAPPPAAPSFAQAPPPPPADAPAGPIAPEALMERLRKMEEMNQKLLDRFEALEDENKKLKKQYEDLSQKEKKKEEKEKGDKTKKDAQAKEEEERGSGIAGQGGWWKVMEAEGGEEFLPPGFNPGGPGMSGGGSTSGTRLLPESQGVGNRFLGKIPVKAGYDYGKNGFFLQTDDGELSLKFRNEIQTEYLGYLNPGSNPTSSGFYIPRVRYYFYGNITRPIDYQLSFQRSYSTFAPLNVYLNFNYDKRLQFRVGRFKLPYTYEFYKLNNWRLIAPERSLYNLNFQLNREIGLMGWGELFDGRMEYAVGIFDGPRNSFQDYNTGKDVVAFLNFTPFVNELDSPLRNLNVGGSVDYGRQDNPLRPEALRTNVNESTAPILGNDVTSSATLPFLAFNSDVTEKGIRNLWELHVAYYYRGLSLLGAWDQGINGFARKGQTPVALPVGGYFIQAAYFLTGETLNERAVIDPIRRFDLRKGKFGLGAWEIHGRFSQVGVGNQVFTAGLADPNLWTNQAYAIDTGVNWYLNKFMKIYFDWQHAVFAQPVYYNAGPSGPLLQKTSDLLWVRFQLYY